MLTPLRVLRYQLNLRHPMSRKALGNRNVAHAIVYSSMRSYLHGYHGGDHRHLWRFDPDDKYCPTLYVQAPLLADTPEAHHDYVEIFTRLKIRACKDVTPVIPGCNVLTRFRVEYLNSEAATPAEAMETFRNNSHRSGFAVEDASYRVRKHEFLRWDKKINRQHTVRHTTIDITGEMRIINAQNYERSRRFGIGDGRGYGHGLILTG